MAGAQEMEMEQLKTPQIGCRKPEGPTVYSLLYFFEPHTLDLESWPRGNPFPLRRIRAAGALVQLCADPRHPRALTRRGVGAWLRAGKQLDEVR